MSMEMTPPKKRDKWLVGRIALYFVLLVVVGVILTPGHAGGESARRASCAYYMAGVVKGMMAYAQENSYMFPTVVTDTYAQVAQAPAGGDTGSADPETAAPSLFTPGERKASQCLWLMVILGQVQPQQFVCRSDEASSSLRTVSTSSIVLASDFAGSKNLSYSVASPWVEGTRAGAAGLPVAPWWHHSGNAAQPLLADGIKAEADFKRDMDVCPNHYGAGSNVAFADGHAEWVPITKQGANYSLQVPSGGMAPDASGIFATGAVFPSGRYAAPTTMPVTRFGAVYDMIFVPPLSGRDNRGN
jgi:prepilin-type processing-associated H-X9-DG protein